MLATIRESPWAVLSDRVALRTDRRRQFIDLTDLVAERVRRSGVEVGLASVQVRHTTAALVVNEDEELLRGDLDALFERLAPADATYAHDDMTRRTAPEPDERRNGAAHCKSVLLGSFETLQIVGGELQLGRWQRLLLVELDGPRPREVSILVFGLPSAS